VLLAARVVARTRRRFRWAARRSRRRAHPHLYLSLPQLKAMGAELDKEKGNFRSRGGGQPLTQKLERYVSDLEVRTPDASAPPARRDATTTTARAAGI
jgi:hypothetical protein